MPPRPALAEDRYPGGRLMKRGVLLRRAGLVKCCLLFLVIVLGCMSLSIGGHHESIANDESGPAEHGKVTVPAHQELDVYYPAGFVSPPNLAVESTWDDCVVVSQAPDHFRIKNPDSI